MVRELRYIIKIFQACFAFFTKLMSSEDQNKREQKENIAEEVDEGNDNYDDVQRELDAIGILEEVDETNENEDADRKNNITDHPNMELDEFSIELVDDSAEEKNNDVSEEFPSIPGINEIDDNSAEPLEEVHTYISSSLLFLDIVLFVTIFLIIFRH